MRLRGRSLPGAWENSNMYNLSSPVAIKLALLLPDRSASPRARASIARHAHSYSPRVAQPPSP
jgi:hypothetical protein